jgi:hypothetical protein
MTKPVLFLRIASGLTFIHGVLHTIGGVFGKTGSGAPAIAVAAMKANQFPLMGNMRTYWDFYHGMGLGVSISLTADAALFWLLASLARKDALALRPIMATFLLAYLALAVNSYTYFFPAPVIVEILIALCLAAAFITAKPKAAA